MTTYADIVEECLSHLYGYGEVRDKVTTLTQDIGATDLTFTVADGKQINRGFIEIDSELIAVASVDSSTGTVTVQPWGRGARGTTAAAHTNTTQVTDTPRFPRSTVKREVNEVIGTLYPDLFNVTVDESNTVSPVVVTYPVPADVESILSVQYQSIGPSRQWIQVNRYALDYGADTTAFPTGKSLDIYQGMAPGKPIKIRYRRKFGTLVNETDTLASVYVSEDWRDIIRMGVVGRLLMSLDSDRLELSSIEASNRAQFVQPLQASAVGRQNLQNMQLRIAQERRELLIRYPSTQVRQS